MQRFVGAIDQGTTSTRFIVFDHSGNIVASAQKEHRQYYPAPGWVEHDAEEIWLNTKEVIQTAMRNSGLSNENIASLGITNQRETIVLWDQTTGKPYINAVVWQDTRSAEICKTLEQNHFSQKIKDKTGLPLSTYFSGPKLKWLLENNPFLIDEIEAGRLLFGTVDSWLVWNLTGGSRSGVHVTDVTNASRTMLMNIQSRTWDKELLEIFDIPYSILPKIVSCSEVYGTTNGLLEQVPISGILGDQQAALFGQACFNPGDVKNTYGTGCFMLLNTGEKPVFSQNGLLTTIGYQLGAIPPVYCLEGSIAITGALVQWLRDNLQVIESSNDIEPLARTVQDNGDVYFVPAFSGLYAPYWQSDARGIIVGLTRYANKGHLARAVIEATAFQTKDVLDAMIKDSGVNLTSLKVDGGMVINDLLMQFQSDLLRVPVVKPKITETTALGAAYAAGLAVNYWNSLDELSVNWARDKEWNPRMNESASIHLYSRWKKAVEKSFAWAE